MASANFGLDDCQIVSQVSSSIQTTSSSTNNSVVELRVQSPEAKRRNASAIWEYIEKVGDKTRCRVENCTTVWSSSTGNSTISTHLANVHKITIKTRGLIL